MSDIVERLRDVSIYLGDAIAGYRDDNLKRAARGAVDIARTTQEAADEIERLRADNAEMHRKLDAIAKHPDVPLLIKQYASGALDGRALEPKP